MAQWHCQDLLHGRGKAGNKVMGHSWQTSGPSSVVQYVTNAVLIETAVSCWHRRSS